MISFIKLIAVWFLVILFLISFVCIVYASNDLTDEPQTNRLPFCNEHETQYKDRNVGYVVFLGKNNLDQKLHWNKFRNVLFVGFYMCQRLTEKYRP